MSNLPDYEFGETNEAADAAPRVIVKLYESVDDVDLGKEMLASLQMAQQLLVDAESNNKIPLAQKGTVLNSVTTILLSLKNAQVEVWNAERLKAVEAILINTLREFPDIKAAFLLKYKEALKNAGLDS